MPGDGPDSTNFLLTGLPNETDSNQSEYSRAIANPSASNIDTSGNSGDRTERERRSNEIDFNQTENSRVRVNPPDNNINPSSNSDQLEPEDVSEFTTSLNNDEDDSEDDDYQFVKYEASEFDFAVPDSSSCANDLQNDSTNIFLLTGLPNEIDPNQSEYSRAIIANPSESNISTSWNSGDRTDSNINTSLNNDEMDSENESKTTSLNNGEEDGLYRTGKEVTTQVEIAGPLLNSPAQELEPLFS